MMLCIVVCPHYDVVHVLLSSGDIAPVGPTSFEFVVPENAPVTVSPSVGTVEPGKVREHLGWSGEHAGDLGKLKVS